MRFCGFMFKKTNRKIVLKQRKKSGLNKSGVLSYCSQKQLLRKTCLRECGLK